MLTLIFKTFCEVIQELDDYSENDRILYKPIIYKILINLLKNTTNKSYNEIYQIFDKSGILKFLDKLIEDPNYLQLDYVQLERIFRNNIGE